MSHLTQLQNKLVGTVVTESEGSQAIIDEIDFHTNEQEYIKVYLEFEESWFSNIKPPEKLNELMNEEGYTHFSRDADTDDGRAVFVYE